MTFQYPNYPGFAYNMLAEKRMPIIKRPRRMIMLGERPIHYWTGVPIETEDPQPKLLPPFVGHEDNKPWTPVVFCDGHVSFIKMTPGLNGRDWALAQKGWCSERPNEGD